MQAKQVIAWRTPSRTLGRRLHVVSIARSVPVPLGVATACTVAAALLIFVWTATVVAGGSPWEEHATAGIQAYEQGRLVEAEQRFSQALQIAERASPRDWRLVASLENLADTLRAQARVPEAEALYRRALAVAEELRGPYHPSLFDPLHHLTWFYHRLGRYVEAERLYERAVDLAERTVGPAHGRVAGYLNALADLARLQAHYRRAESLSRRALPILEQFAGPDDPNVAGTLNDLAVTLQLEGQHQEATAIAQRAVSVLEKDVRYAEAFFRTALRMREEMLGAGHPSVARSLYNLARVRELQGDYAEAEALHQRALAVLRRALGPEHLHVAVNLENYAALLRRAGRETDARVLEARAAAIRAALGRPEATPGSGSDAQPSSERTAE